MNDPHVESLVYELELGEGLAFNYPPPLDHETEHFALRLDSGTLTVSMKEHHPSTRSARERVEPFLHSWELDNDLRYGPGTLRFAYQKSVVVDRNPPSSGTHRSSELEGMVMATTFGGQRHLQSRHLSSAPIEFRGITGCGHALESVSRLSREKGVAFGDGLLLSHST